MEAPGLHARRRGGVPDHWIRRRGSCAPTSRRSSTRASSSSRSASSPRCTSRSSRSARASARTSQRSARTSARCAPRSSASPRRTACASRRPARTRSPTGPTRRSSRTPATTRSSQEMQLLARANLIFGLHVHVGIKDRALAFQIMNEALYFLPHLLALSTNSPFWLGRNTGLKSFRTKVFDRFPRTGMPEYFETPAEFDEFVRILVEHQLDRQRQEDLVGRAPAPVLRDDRVPRLRRADASRRDRHARRALPGDLRQALQAAPAEPGLPTLPPRA